jgi:hypothetical protein
MNAMKKVFLLLTAIVGLTLASCNGTASTEAVAPAEQDSAATQVEADTVSVDTTVVE